MDLRTGESVQLTESGAVAKDTPDISYDGKEVYYIETDKSFHAINLESLQQREICKLNEIPGDFSHALSLTPDNRFAIIGAALEPRRNVGYEYPTTRPVIRSALIVIRTGNGQRHRLIDGNAPLGHVAFCPADGNLVLYSLHVIWSLIQRPWLIRADGTEHRPIFVQRQGEGVGHEFWGASGRTVFVTCHGGRQPQGLWAANVDGSNERCVLAGANVAHGTASPEEDRYIVDELYTETTSLWMSRKGSPTPQVLCKMATEWFAPNAEGKLQPTRHHPHPRFLPNGTGVTFSSGGEIYLVEV